MSTTDKRSGDGDDSESLLRGEFSDRSLGRRREDWLQALNYFDLRISTLEKKGDKESSDMEDMRKYIESHRLETVWIHENKQHIINLVEGSKWAVMTRRVIIVIAGSIIGAIMFVQSVWPLIAGKSQP